MLRKHFRWSPGAPLSNASQPFGGLSASRSVGALQTAWLCPANPPPEHPNAAAPSLSHVLPAASTALPSKTLPLSLRLSAVGPEQEQNNAVASSEDGAGGCGMVLGHRVVQRDQS